MKKLLATLVTLVMIVSSLAVLTSCGAKDGLTPSIGENGNWFIGETDTGVPATGPKGDKGDTGATGPKGDDGNRGYAGADGKDAVAPSFRYNIVDGCFEYSYDGETWTAVPVVAPDAGEPETPVAPADALKDTTLSSYSYPMEYVTAAEGTILDKNGRYEVLGNGKYSVALIDITGCVFDKVKLVANETGYELSWCFLTAMPTIDEVAPFCEGFSKLVGPEDDPDADEVTIDIPADATVLVVYYQGWWNHNGNAADAHCPSSITFLKDGAPQTPADALKDTTLSSYSYPMEHVTAAEGTIIDSNGKYEVVGNGKYSVALIDITGCVFDKVKLVANETGYELKWCFLTAMPTIDEVAPFCEGFSKLVGPEDDPDADEVTIDIPADATVLVVYYQGWWNHNGNAADAHCPSSITFLKGGAEAGAE